MTTWADTDDTDLLLLVRDGHTDAMAELWSRHYPATLTAARRISRQPQDAEEFASDAFSGMLHAISNDGGPSVSVRGYLLTAVRNQAANRARRASANDVLTDELTDFEDPDRTGHDPVAHHAELGLVRQAFATLPASWQIVLWRTAVDHDKNTVIAADLDRSPNALAALAKRARQGFRVAYLRAHESTHGVAEACAPYASRLVELLPDADTVATADVREHVADCPRCARRLADLRIIDADLGGALLPALLTLGPGIAWITGAQATHVAAGGGAAWLNWWRGPDRTRTLTIAGTAAGVIVAGTCAAFALTHSGSTKPYEALAPAASQNAAAAAHSGTGSANSSAAPSGTQSSSAASSAAKRSSAAKSASNSSSAASSSSTTSTTGTTTSTTTGSESSTTTTSSQSRRSSATRPGTSTTSVSRTSTATGTSTAPATHTTTSRPTSTSPSPSHTLPPKPSPTSTKPRGCMPIFCWPWDFSS